MVSGNWTQGVSARAVGAHQREGPENEQERVSKTGGEEIAYHTRGRCVGEAGRDKFP